jgi:hypothetical protein
VIIVGMPVILVRSSRERVNVVCWRNFVVALPVECLECGPVFQGASLVGRVEDVCGRCSTRAGESFWVIVPVFWMVN